MEKQTNQQRERHRLKYGKADKRKVGLIRQSKEGGKKHKDRKWKVKHRGKNLPG